MHTPGPWHISKTGKYIRKNDGPNWPAWNIAEINQNHERAGADARLIVAAPDLLAALEEIEAHHVEQNRIKGRDESRSHTLQIARAAIAKAKG